MRNCNAALGQSLGHASIQWWLEMNPPSWGWSLACPLRRKSRTLIIYRRLCAEPAVPAAHRRLRRRRGRKATRPRIIAQLNRLQPNAAAAAPHGARINRIAAMTSLWMRVFFGGSRELEANVLLLNIPIKSFYLENINNFIVRILWCDWRVWCVWWTTYWPNKS